MRQKTSWILKMTLMAGGLILSSTTWAGGVTPAGEAAVESGDPKPFAYAKMIAGASSQASGSVEFYRDLVGLGVKVNMRNVPPGQHGFSIYQFGDCSALDFSSAGAHFDPSGSSHGAPDDSASHKGDLGNLVANDEGVISYEGYVRPNHGMDLIGWRSIIGKALILHEKADDLRTPGTGNAGERLSCGVISYIY